MLRNIYIVIIFFTVILSALNTPAQTGKPQYIIRTERADTVLGYMTIELFPEIAPLHSAYFDSLVNISFYDSTAFHRVVPDFVIQGGDPNSINGPRDTWGEGDPSQSTIPAEFSGVSHLRGIIGAARDADINSANSQFYVNIVDNKFLDWNYTAYGQVLEGMDVADLIVSVPRDGNDNPHEKIEMFISKGSFTNEVPNVPVLTYPTDGEGGLLDRDSLKWDPVDGAVMYTVHLSDNIEFNTLLADEQVGSNYYTLDDPELGNVQLYWRVMAHNGGNVSEYSETGNFYTSIEATELISPEVNDTVSVNPQFEWQAIDGADAYRLQVARSPNFQADRIVYDVDTITSTSHVTASELEGNKSHYWRVYSMTDEYEGPVSGFRRFITEDVTSTDKENQLPAEYVLHQNYPNPFSAEGGSAYGGNPHTTIGYKLPASRQSANEEIQSAGIQNGVVVTLKVYNILGKEVATLVNAEQKPGHYEIMWDASGLTSGIYFYKLTAGSFSEARKMVLLR